MFSSALWLPVHFCRIFATIDSQCFIFVYCFCGLYLCLFSFLITQPKNGAKLLQNFELCKFFGKKIFQQFYKVVQNKNVNHLFSTIYIFKKHQKLSKIKSFQQSPFNFFIHSTFFSPPLPPPFPSFLSPQPPLPPPIPRFPFPSFPPIPCFPFPLFLSPPHLIHLRFFPMSVIQYAISM